MNRVLEFRSEEIASIRAKAATIFAALPKADRETFNTEMDEIDRQCIRLDIRLSPPAVNAATVPGLRPDADQKPGHISGGDVSYYLVNVPDPKRLDPYTMEAEDIVEALKMEFAEATVFTGVIRLCKMIMGIGKPGNTEVYEAEKLVYYSQRALAKAKRRAP